MESGLIAEGSLKGLLTGTHFNRCKKIHPVAALCFKILHFKEFLKEYDKENHINKLDSSEIIEILDNDSSKIIDRTLFELKDVLDHYNTYTQKTLNGEHGFTAKYALLYTSFIEYYQLFERPIRTSDLNLYIYAAYRLRPLFFIFNHQNYARWLSRNLDELMNIERTNPGLNE